MNLVFASGFLFPQTLFGGIDYFRRLRTHFKGKHATAFPPVSPAASSEARAQQLADGIAREFPHGDIHIIAHSMGGLDSRILIARDLNGLSRRIVSLTTLSTPHRGSPVADLLAGHAPDGVQRQTLDRATLAIRALGIDIGALADLTTERATRLPDPTQTHPHVRYRSYFAAGRPGPLKTSALLLPLHKFVQEATGEPNDGVVTRESARFGELQEPFWDCDHLEMVGHNLDTADLIHRFDHFRHFDAIVDQLQAQ